jgi:L-alanine-DL-glutamate epimerase-like enolase superfamily enzyme
MERFSETIPERALRQVSDPTSIDPIERVEAETVTLELPRTLRLGPMVISERHYAVVRITTRTGLVGYAYGQTRGAPVTEIVDRLLAPALTGADSTSVAGRWEDCFRATMAVGRVGLVIRALSLVDIALWDVHAQRAGVPLYRALSDEATRVPVMRVVGYPGSADDVDPIAQAGRDAIADGCSAVKIARSQDPLVTRALLSRFADELPDETRIVVDANWVWTDPSQALNEVRGWPIERIGWLEDPFPPESIDKYRALREARTIPIGVGEEVTDPMVHRSLLSTDAVDVLRVDVTTIGGYTRAEEVVRLARASGIPVSFHVYPEISAHAAVAWAGHSIETFDRSGNPYDPSHTLVDGGPSFDEGFVGMLDVPGIGFTIDPERFR